MIVNDPAVVAEIKALFSAYEHALVTNDVTALDAFFLNSEGIIRYGVDENLYGISAVRAFRAARSAAGLSRTLEGTVITTYGDDIAIAATLFRRAASPDKIGRQMQTWVRLPGGWRIVGAMSA